MKKDRAITKTELLQQIYNAQKQMSKNRNMKPPEYSFYTLKNRYANDFMFMYYFNQWVASGYNKGLRPSIDRINPLKAYTASNTQVMTWNTNERKGSDELVITRGRGVKMLDDWGRTIMVFRSITDAAFITKVNKSSIERACKGNYNAGGYRWEYLGKRRSHK